MPESGRPGTGEPGPGGRRGFAGRRILGCVLPLALPAAVVGVTISVLVVGTLLVAPTVVEHITWDADQRRRARSWAPRVSHENRWSFTGEGKAIVAALEAHRAEHGTYPERLEDLAGCESGWTDWRYVRTEPDRARLQVGEYDLHLFEFTWTSANGWYYDS